VASQTGRLFIAGEWVEPSKGGYAVVNPATEQVVAEAPEAGVDQVDDAVGAARDAFPSWSRRSPEERGALLHRLADAFERRIPDLAPLVQAETGATMRVAKTLQVMQCAVRFRRYADLAKENHDIPLPPSVMGNTALAKGGLIGALAARAPVGVVACITPYNFPLTNMAGKVAPALAMGNTVVVKPAPQDPLAVLKFAEAVEEAGLPPGVFNVVTGSGADAGQALVEADIDMVSFTGSTPVGQRIAETAGRGMKRLLLELGGKGAAVVFDDGDLAGAVAGIGSTWSFHSGQICTAPTRVIAHRSIHDQLVEKLSAYARLLKVGDPLADDTVVGPVISEVQRERIESLLEAGRQDGVEFVVGGDRPDIATGFYVAPTLLTGVRNDMRVAQEEFFGPVVVVETFDDEDEAIALANGTPFGLYDYVWTADAVRGYRVARQLRSGNVGINTVQRNHEAPFGGFKMSGVGRDGGVFGLHAYSELQSIVWPS
jgi:acyl-CoA reductase-like NAD-dependent aldehyde dehydrogenase